MQKHPLLPNPVKMEWRFAGSALANGAGGGTDGADVRLAVQAAAGALALAVPCDNIVMCAVAATPEQLAQARLLSGLGLKGLGYIS